MKLEEGVALKDLITLTSPLIKSLVDVFVQPKLENFKKKYNLNSDDLPISSDNFNEYYHRTFKKLAVVNTLVFNNTQKFLTDIFIPLTIVSKNNNDEKYKIVGYPEEVCDNYSNILITDTAGMGKSTMMKTIFLDLINRHHGIPLFVELRRLNKNKNILDEIKEQLNSLKKEFNLQILTDLLSEGEFIIILDGYDEIPLSDRDIVTKDIQDFITRTSNNKFIITSRPEKSLTSFGNFQEFKILPLAKKEAFELLRKYDNKGSVSNLLIKKLQENDMKPIEEFLTNPLLVSLLFTAFEHKQVIPFKKYLFYRQVYDANFESHDLTKGESYIHDKYSKLEIDDFHKILRHIGYNCFKMQKIEFSKDEILKIINDAKEFYSELKFNNSNFLDDLIKTVPLFTQDGNYYRWSHKSLQEYFAAQFIYLDSKIHQNLILEKIYNHDNLDKFINILDLYYDMDYKTFRNTIELALTNDYILFHKNNYLNYSEEFSVDSINKRKELTFLLDSFLFKARDLAGSFFDGKRFGEMTSNCELINGFSKNKFSGVLIQPYVTCGEFKVYLLNYQYSKLSLLRLLYDKKNSLVKMLNKHLTQETKIDINWEISGEYELIRIANDKDLIYNSITNFEELNTILALTSTINIVIDTDEAFIRNKIIQENIKYERENDFSIDGF